MKKILVSLAVVFGFSAYALRGHMPHLADDEEAPLISLNRNTAVQPTPTNTAVVGNTNTTPPTNSSVAVENTNTTPPVNTNTASNSGAYTNGQYTGSVVDALYGNVQVVATIAGGKLTDVVAAKYPNNHGHSIEINRYALPRLKSEAIAAQSAQIDIISGATYTSLAYQESLQTALKAAAK